MKRFFYHIVFKFRFHYISKIVSLIRKTGYRLLGMHVGENTILPKTFVTWPHQIKIGRNCRLEHNIFFKVDGIGDSGIVIRIQDRVFIGANCEFNIRKGIQIGSDSLIASGCKFIDHDHGTKLHKLIRIQHGPEEEIFIGTNAWLGVNVVVLKGVSIGDGAIIAAGAVLTKSVPSNEIWGGVPAKKIGDRV